MEDFKFASPQKSSSSEIKRSFFRRFFVYSEFVPHGQTVDRTFGLKVLKRLRNSLRCFVFPPRQRLCSTALCANFDQKLRDPCASPPYSPDLAPCDFPRIKRNMKGKRFVDVAELKEKMTEPLSEDDLKKF